MAITIHVNPSSATYYRGQSASNIYCSATSSTGGYLEYEWRRNGSYFGNGTSIKPSTDSVGTFQYQCVIYDATSSETARSSTATITVKSTPSPTINGSSLSDATYLRGTSANTLSVSASSASGTISYQWQQSGNGSSWSNAGTGSSLTPSTSSVGTTYYRCIVRNTLNGYYVETTSGTARITVYEISSPTITSQPQGANYFIGQTAAPISVSVSASDSVSYQWQKSAEASGPFANISGATGRTYIPPTSNLGSTYYRCVVTNSANGYSKSATSNAAQISVFSPKLEITQNPESANYYVDDPANPMICVADAGGATISYQWQKKGPNDLDFTPIPGATGSQYTPPTASAGTVRYRCYTSVGNGEFFLDATSEIAVITVSVYIPGFTEQPKSADYGLNDTPLPLRGVAQSRGSVITYQWQKSADGITFENIPEATGTEYIPGTFESGTTYYRVIATATNGNESSEMTSEIARIRVYRASTPIFIAPLQSATYQYGSPATPLNGEATAEHAQQIEYKWYWSVDNTSFYPVFGIEGASYTPSTNVGGNRYYYVVATAFFGSSSASTKSNTAVIEILNAEFSPTEAWAEYLKALKTDFVKLARLEFLQPDGSVAFALDNNPMNKRSGAFIQTGNITVNLQNGKRRMATVTLANLDGEFDYNVNKVWFGQQIRISEGLILSNGQEFYLPQGVFYIVNPSETVDPGKRTVTYTLEDKWSYLDGTLFGKLDGVYEVPINQNIFDAITSVLMLPRGNGYMVDNMPPIYTDYYNGQTTTLPDGSVISDVITPYTYRCEGDDGTYANIILEMNTMLAGWIGYDMTGRLRLDPSQDDILDSSKPIQWAFEPEGKQFLGTTYSIKNTEVYNDIIITGESLSEYGNVAGRASNFDPASDTNINLIGRKTLRESAAGYYSEKLCQDLAVFKLKRQTVLQKSVSIKSTQIFHLQENQLVTIRRPDKDGSPVERHLVTGFSRPLAQSGMMTIEATSVQDFPTATITQLPGNEA